MITAVFYDKFIASFILIIFGTLSFPVCDARTRIRVPAQFTPIEVAGKRATARAGSAVFHATIPAAVGVINIADESVTGGSHRTRPQLSNKTATTAEVCSQHVSHRRSRPMRPERPIQLWRNWGPSVFGGRVVSLLDSGTEGPGFKSQSQRCRVTVLGKLFTPIVPLFTKQQNW